MYNIKDKSYVDLCPENSNPITSFLRKFRPVTKNNDLETGRGMNVYKSQNEGCIQEILPFR